MGGADKRARVYFRRDGKRVLVVAVHPGQDGGLVEGEGPLSLTTWDDDALGESITTALDQSTIVARGSANMPGAATLKVSGEPSPRSFDSSFILIQLTSAGAEVVLQASPQKDLTVATRLAGHAPAADFARQATRIFQICRDRKF